MSLVLNGSGIVSSNIVDGTIVNADINASVGFGLQSQQVFTASGTWTKPAGINVIKVYVTGGGGGGAGSGYYRTVSGGGANAGGTAIKIIDVSTITSETITVGLGGTGGAVIQYDSGAGGTAGSTSSFGTHCSATGGTTGTCYENVTGGAGGNGVGGDINIRGGLGTKREPYNGDVENLGGGNGGDSFLGAGGKGGYLANSAGTGVYGGGGGGGHCQTGASDSYEGEDGGSGLIVIEEYS